MSAPPSIAFTCTLLEGEMGAIPIDFDQRALFGKARPPVAVTVNGHSYRSTIAIMGGVTFVPLRQSNREAAGIAPGAAIDVTLTLDTAPRDVELQADVADTLAAAGLRERWEALSFTTKREQAEGIEAAKRPETRARRIAALIASLDAR